MEFFKNIPIGQYIPAESFLHKLDPRTKLIFIFIFVIIIFLTENYISLSMFIMITLVAVMVSQLKISYLWKALKGMLIMILIIGILQLILVKNGELLWSWSGISIYSEGVNKAVFVTLRLLFLVIMTSLLTLTTSPIDLTEGIERLLSPLKRVRLPVHELSLMMTISIRYIPTLMEETDKIIKAQTARGADFESRNIGKRIKSLFPLLVPLFVSSFRRAEDLALAMEARCYRGGEGRTRRKGYYLTWRDHIVAAITLGLLSATVLFMVFS